jgi:hypothetical protein
MTNEAFVIERTMNGIIVRPHAGWWNEDRQRLGVNEVRVFNSLADFQEWFTPWFPIENSGE